MAGPRTPPGLLAALVLVALLVASSAAPLKIKLRKPPPPELRKMNFPNGLNSQQAGIHASVDLLDYLDVLVSVIIAYSTLDGCCSSQMAPRPPATPHPPRPATSAAVLRRDLAGHAAPEVHG